MTRKRFFLYTLIVGLFALGVDLLAYVQFHYVIQIPTALHFYLVPSLVGTIFGTILVLNRHYYMLAREKEHFERLAKTDPLTGSMNRYAAQLILEHEMKRCHRSNAPFSVLMIDVDNFKRVNDHFGHQEGDRILQELCDCMQKELREMDTLCRWGGEEFLIIAPGTSGEGLRHLAERIRESVSHYDFGLNRSVTVSIGAAEGCAACEQIHALIAAADEALYRAKGAGKNTIATA
jgi:diguanylate cyclase